MQIQSPSTDRYMMPSCLPCIVYLPTLGTYGALHDRHYFMPYLVFQVPRHAPRRRGEGNACTRA
jgi:hypothetical protein